MLENLGNTTVLDPVLINSTMLGSNSTNLDYGSTSVLGNSTDYEDIYDYESDVQSNSIPDFLGEY